MVISKLVIDVKLDNVMVRYQQTEEWALDFQQDGHQGWSQHGVYLIDFGSAIDMGAFQPEQMFRIEPNGEADPSVECPALIYGLDWRTEPDLYGVASVAHVLLYGTWMEVEQQDRLQLVRPLKRYWNKCWHQLFDGLLNGDATGLIPLLQEQVTLECNKAGKSLRGLLRTVEASRYQ